MSTVRLSRSKVVRGLSVKPFARVVVGAAALALVAGCSGSETNQGGMPVGEGSGGRTVTLGTPTPEPTTTGSSKPTAPAKTTAAPPPAQITIVPGRFASQPAVQGLVAKYPLYYQALVQRKSDIIKTSFPAFFYADTAVNIEAARQSGWVMRPPGSVVVVGTSNQPDGVIRVNLCRSQRMQWWNPKTRKWVIVAPRGTAEAIDMVRTGLGWTMYRLVRPVPKGINCSAVRYPA